jgi:hypothetical protein
MGALCRVTLYNVKRLFALYINDSHESTRCGLSILGGLTVRPKAGAAVEAQAVAHVGRTLQAHPEITKVCGLRGYLDAH